MGGDSLLLTYKIEVRVLINQWNATNINNILYLSLRILGLFNTSLKRGILYCLFFSWPVDVGRRRLHILSLWAERELHSDQAEKSKQGCVSLSKWFDL